VSTLPVVPPSPKLTVFQRRALEVINAVKDAVVNDAETHQQAGKMSRAIAELRKGADELYAETIAAAHAAHVAALDAKKRLTIPLDQSQREIDAKILKYEREQEAIRRRREDELRRELQKQQEEQALAEAAELARQGEHATAELVLQQAAEAPAPVVSLPKATDPIAGFAKRVNWRFRITDPKKVPREYLRPDEVAIGAVVRALKGATKIDGVEVYAEESAIHRS